MGFFSSIGKAFKKVVNVGKDIVGGVVDAVTGDPLGAVSTVGNLIGGIASNNAKADANAASLALAQEQFDFQKQYIQNQIQWKLEDAKKAGIHPLAALGIQSPGFSSVSNSTTPLDYSWLGDIGQSSNYAATKAKTTPQQQQMLDLQIEGMKLDNDFKRAQIDQLKVDTLASTIATNQGFDSPPSPIVNLQEPTGLPTSLVDRQPMSVTPYVEIGKEPAANPSVGWIQNDDGSVSPVMSSSAKERLEEDLVGTALWNIRNRISPHVKTMFGRSVQDHTPPKSLLPKGAVRWEYNGFGEYVPLDSKGNIVRPKR